MFRPRYVILFNKCKIVQSCLCLPLLVKAATVSLGDLQGLGAENMSLEEKLAVFKGKGDVNGIQEFNKCRWAIVIFVNKFWRVKLMYLYEAPWSCRMPSRSSCRRSSSTLSRRPQKLRRRHGKQLLRPAEAHHYYDIYDYSQHLATSHHRHAVYLYGNHIAFCSVWCCQAMRFAILQFKVRRGWPSITSWRAGSSTGVGGQRSSPTSPNADSPHVRETEVLDQFSPILLKHNSIQILVGGMCANMAL